MSTRAFSAKILIIGANPYVRPPDSVLKFIFKQAGKDKSPIPVKGTINGAPFQQSLVRYSGDWKLYINNIMAKAAGIKFTGSIAAIVGKKIKITVGFNPTPPTYSIPTSLQKALIKDKKAKIAFDKLTPGRQKEIARYLGFMKTEEALNRNIERMLKHLRGEKSDALHALLHRK
jgi:hypothetical protein